MTIGEEIYITGLRGNDEQVTAEFFNNIVVPCAESVARRYFSFEKEMWRVVASDVFVEYAKKSYKAFEEFEGGDSSDGEDCACLKAFVRRTAENICLKLLKKEQKEELLSFDAPLEQGPSLTTSGIQDECDSEEDEELLLDAEYEESTEYGSAADNAARNVNRLISKLDGPQRDVINLILREVSYPEIAETLGLSEANVRQIKHRAVEKMCRIARHGSGSEALCAILAEHLVLSFCGIHIPLHELISSSISQGWLQNEGYSLDNIGNHCREAGLEVCAETGGTLDSLRRRIESGYAAIVAVDGGELYESTPEEIVEDMIAEVSDHCVVVTAVNEDSVLLFDPAISTGPVFASRDTFRNAWLDSNCFGVYCRPR